MSVAVLLVIHKSVTSIMSYVKVVTYITCFRGSTLVFAAFHSLCLRKALFVFLLFKPKDFTLSHCRVRSAELSTRMTCFVCIHQDIIAVKLRDCMEMIMG